MASLHTSPSTLPKPKTPNFLIILTDEERYPVPEESEELRHFRETQLLGRKMLRESGITFHNHYTAATACTPSRASFFTGQYPTLHGVSETYGFAKGANDPRIAWLEPNTVPTMGDLFRRAGYETVYKGKWHISKADILDEHGEEIMSVTEDGKRIPEAEDLYLKRQPLDEFGFQDWIGPEPHGAKIENGGINRDPTFSDQVCEYLGQREERIRSGEQVKPFLMVASLVNPHDVALYPQFKALGMDLCDETVPEVPAAPSDQEDLSTKPSPQRKYLEAFKSLYCSPEVHEMLFSCKEEMRRMYYYLHKLVDHDIRQMYGKLMETSFFNDTVVIFTSDHGDMLGAHGNLLQKWTVAYQEAIHIPLIISAPFLPTGDADFCTSAVDLIPTMLGLAGVDHHDLMHRMAETHSEAHPLVGNDFSSVLTLERGPETQLSNVTYFMTEDEVTKGNSQVSIRGGIEYDAVEGPCHIESVICFLEDRETGEREQWKFTRYFDNPERWSHPFKKDVCIIRQGPMRGRVVVRTTKHDDEFELYNLTRDPSELHNLAHPSVIDSLPAADRARVINTAASMAGRLAQTAEERRRHRNSPRPARVITPTYLVESKL